MELKKKLHENVYYYTNVIPNAKEILEIVEKLESDSASYPAISEWKTDFSERKRKDLFPHGIEQVKGENKELVDKVINTMLKAFNNVAESFYKDRGLEGTPNVSPMLDLCKYEKGGRIGVHFDAQDGDKSLVYTMVLYFNNDQDGGEISFAIMDSPNKSKPNDSLEDPNIDFWVKPEPGSVIIFPSTYPYLHQSHKVRSGNKYMSTSFVFVDGYDNTNPEHIKKYRLDFKGK
jgi:hypothetical protein